MHISRQKSITSRSIKTTGALIVSTGIATVRAIYNNSYLYYSLTTLFLQAQYVYKKSVKVVMILQEKYLHFLLYGYLTDSCSF